MDASLIRIDGEAELARAHRLVERLIASVDPVDMARLQAQSRLISAYEEEKWPVRRPTPAELLVYLMVQHDVTRAQLAPILGSTSRVSEVLRGKKGLSMAMVQRLRARFRIPADLLLPPPEPARARRSLKKDAA